MNAVETGEISEERIDESVLRILRLKINRGIITEEDFADGPVEAESTEESETGL